MSYYAVIMSIVIAHLLAVISPGPDFVMAVRNSLRYSRRTGVWTALGFALGIAVHVTYTVFGLALMISNTPLLFDFIKWAGAIYLMYIGIRSILAKKSSLTFSDVDEGDIAWYNGIQQGFLTNVLNPKATLFFFSIFTLVITPDVPKWVWLVASLIMILNTFLWFAIVAFLFTQKRVQSAFAKWESIIHKTLGLILIGLGGLIIFS